MKLSTKNLISYYCVFLFTSLSYGQTEVNDFDDKGKTPLINAISNKDIPKVKQLIRQGADVNLKEQKSLQGTPLMYAASTGDKVLCQLLIDNGANVNQLDINKDPALNWATYYGQIKVMKYLIEQGADYKIVSKHGNATDVALRLWHHDSVANVFRPYYKNKSITKHEYKFIKAVKKEDYNVINRLLKKGVSPNLNDEIGIPVLQLASQKGDEKMVAFLIKNGADVNCLNRVGQTPLAWAVRFGHLETAKLLLDAGANPNKTDTKYQLTPLIAAAVNGDVKIGELLLKNGADISHREIVNNVTALHWAIFQNKTEFAKFLVNNGANYHKKALQDNQYSAYDLVGFYKNEELQTFFDTKDKEQKQKKLIGSWKIKEIHYLYPDTTYVFKAFDYGRLILSNSHYAIQYNPYMKKRTPFRNLSKGEDAEIKRAFQSIVFNSGRYTLEDDVIHTIADVAKVPGFEEGHQYYRTKLVGDKLSLTMYDETYPNGQKPEWFGKLKIKFILKKE
ncbi:MAG: ankyrin repeat domain-containing protein [Flavobacteriaceae bacterium]|nr:ankyrin repeat domain-containing protein [Flavobacteriaceae bacterium]